MVKNLPANAGDSSDVGSTPGSGNLLEEEMTTHSVFLFGESHGQRGLADYSPWGLKELGTTEHSIGRGKFLSNPSVFKILVLYLKCFNTCLTP